MYKHVNLEMYYFTFKVYFKMKNRQLERLIRHYLTATCIKRQGKVCCCHCIWNIRGKKCDWNMNRSGKVMWSMTSSQRLFIYFYMYSESNKIFFSCCQVSNCCLIHGFSCLQIMKIAVALRSFFNLFQLLGKNK